MPQFDKNLESHAKRQSNIIFQDENHTFLECDGVECVRYYVPTTIYRRVLDFWDGRENRIFFIISKVYETHTYDSKKPHVSTILLSHDNFMTAYDDTNEMSVNDLFLSYPNLKNKLIETFKTNDTYEVLKRISNGFEYDKYSIRKVDDSISNIKFNKNAPSRTMIQLSFDTEEYIRLFYETDGNNYYDEVSFILGIIGRGGYFDYQFNDISQSWEDWSEGYLIRNFNEQNLQKFDKIGNFLIPSVFSKDTETGRAELCDRLQSSFNRNVERMVDSWHELEEAARRDGIVEDVESSFSNNFENFGIYNPSGKGYRNLVTVVSTLIKLYDTYGMEGFSIAQLLREIISQNRMWGASYQENIYDYYGTFDNESFNREVSSQLDDILENIENADFFYDIEGYKELLDTVSKYSMSKWIPLPYDNTKKFLISDIDEKTNTIKVHVNKGGITTLRKFNLDQFNNFLHSPELFD